MRSLRRKKKKWLYRAVATPEDRKEHDNATAYIYRSKAIKGDECEWLSEHFTFKCSFCKGVFAKVYSTGQKNLSLSFIQCPLCGARFIKIQPTYKD